VQKANILDISVTLDVVQEPIFALNRMQLKNILDILVTAIVLPLLFHNARPALLNLEHELNIFDILVIFSVFQPLRL